MFPVVYETAKWIGLGDKRFIYSHALNRKLNQEEHSHEFFEIIFLFTGSATHRVNGTVRQLEVGDVTILRPGDSHLFTEQSVNFELFSISVITDEIMRFCKAFQLESALLYVESPIVYRMSNSQTASCLQLFRKLSILPSGEERDTLLRVILGMTMQNYTLQTLEQKRDWLQNILFLMKQHDNLVEGVPAMMRIANLSHAQLCRTMRKLSLQPPKFYIKELRLSTAHEMIQNTSLSFEDIALQVGYSSLSHFSTAFKKRFGLSPSTLRKNSTTYLI